MQPTHQFRRLIATVPLSCAVIGLAVASACVRVPELEDRLTPDLRGTAYPDLIPLESALATSPAPAKESQAIEQSLEARAARLQARADALRNAQP